MKPPVLRVTEVASVLKYDVSTVYKLIKRGQIRAVKSIRAMRVPREAVSDYLGSNDWEIPQEP